jgi:hypothetical protein
MRTHVLYWMGILTGFVVACAPEGGDASSDDGNGGNDTTTSANGASTSATTGGSTGSGDTVDDDMDGFSEAQGDCNDANPAIHPNAPEVCDDNVDNDCDGAVDMNQPDADGDGFGPCAGDCNDADPLVNPAAVEIPGDNIDNNCDGTVDADFDGDGFTEAMGDCNDMNSDVYPGAEERCFDNVDNDCDTFVDENEPDGDGDGFGPCAGDCDDTNPAVYPGAPEIPNDGIDNNCDFLIDADIDGDGFTTQNGDCNDLDPNINPSVFETCGDNIDNDCDGTTDTDCVTKCDLAELFKTSVGCTYYAIDANNDPAEFYDTLPYAVVVSNTDPVDIATVDVQTKTANVWTTIQTANVAPGTLHQFDLPDRHVNNTNLNLAGAYRVVSSVPVVAYQFQPINGESSFTSDASLLIPTSALDRFYFNVGWGEPSFGNAQINIVAAEDGTTITVTPSVATIAGGGIPALPANVAYTFPATFGAGDVIQLEATGGGSTGLSGTFITANKTLSVFSTHWCANIATQVCCCDHLEEQLFGLQTWGKTYVAARHPVRNSGATAEATYWHIIASEDATNITFRATPGVTGLPGPTTLNRGQTLQVAVGGPTTNPGDFIVIGDKPILVMQYMSSSANTNASVANAGDPFMTQAVPVEQFLDNYVVLAPANWINDRMVITKPVGATVTVDGNPIPQASFLTINDGVNPPAWEVARIVTADGVHSLTGTAPFGVTVLGYDSYDSYAYPGGLNQQIINPQN